MNDDLLMFSIIRSTKVAVLYLKVMASVGRCSVGSFLASSPGLQTE